MKTPEIPLKALSPGRAGALKGGKCQLCQLPLKTRESIDERMRRGDPVVEIRRWAVKFFKDKALGEAAIDAWYRHKRRHVLTLDRAVSKLSDGQREQHKRVKLARAVLRDDIDPQSYFSAAAIAQDLSRAEKRLDSAADSAHADGQLNALASLSGALIRAVEVRGKMGGSINDATQVNLSVSLHELHQRLDPILGSADGNRQLAARSLLGLPQNAPMPSVGNLAAQADPAAPRRRDNAADLTNPLGDPANPLTIDAETTPDSAESSLTPVGEVPGTRWR